MNIIIISTIAANVIVSLSVSQSFLIASAIAVNPKNIAVLIN